MRIVLLNQYYAPAEAATAQLLSDLGEELVREGHRVSAICSRRSYPDPSRIYPARETLAGVSIHRTWTTGFGRFNRLGRLLDYASFSLGAARILALQREVDVVVSLSTPPMVAFLARLLTRVGAARLLFWVMDVYPDLAFELGVLRRGSILARMLSGVGRYTLRRSDAVVALGETMASKLRALGALNVHVIHNWADGTAIRPCPVDGHALRDAWGWNGRFVVLYSGNLGLAHEFDTILDAASRLAADPRVLFAFVGDGPRMAEVRQEADRRGLRNVEFRPHVARAELGRSLTAGDVHLVTLRAGIEGLLVPSKIYGILAAGRPTLYVGPQGVEIARILAEGDCGSRVEIGDARTLADRIRRYSEDEGLRAAEGARARGLFERRFTREQATRAHRAVIESLAGDAE